MKKLYGKSLVIGGFATIGFAGNIYLYNCHEAAAQQTAALQQTLIQKQTLIRLAKDKPQKPSTIGHRLALPCNRLSVSEEFQHLSKSLKLARLDFQISPETIVHDNFSESMVELKFQNVSDQPLFLMMAHLLDEFPGLVYPVEIVMWRDSTLQEPLIRGTFRFQWLKSANKDIAS